MEQTECELCARLRPGERCHKHSQKQGRVKLSELTHGETYFGVHSPTGRCVYRTRSKDEAVEVAGRNPARLSFTEHSR